MYTSCAFLIITFLHQFFEDDSKGVLLEITLPLNRLFFCFLFCFVLFFVLHARVVYFFILFFLIFILQPLISLSVVSTSATIASWDNKDDK